MQSIACGFVRCLLCAIVTLMLRPTSASADSSAAPLFPQKKEAPTAAAQREARKRVNEAYADEIAKTKSPAEKKALARKILQSAMEMQDDPAASYVLLGIARDLAIAGGDAEGALAVLSALDPYQSDGLKAKADTLFALAKFNRAPVEASAFVKTTDHAIDEALAAGRYDVAAQLAKLAASAAKATNDAATLARTTARSEDVREMEAAAPAARKAADKLVKSPRDPDANLFLGRFEGLLVGQWEQSLPHLAAGSDASLKGLAQTELANPVEPDKQIELADRWWDTSGREKGLAQRRIREHAAHLYSVALPKLAGLAKAKAEKRMRESQGGPSAANAGLDLLKTIDLQRDVIHGDWKLKDDRLEIATGATPAVLRIAQSPRKSYKLRIEFQRPSGGDALGIYLPVGTRGVILLLRPKQMGLDLVDGKRFDVNETSRIVELDDHNKHTLDIAVFVKTAEAKITILVDGNEQIDWKGAPTKLEMIPTWAFPAPISLGLGSWDTSFVISGVWLTTED